MSVHEFFFLLLRDPLALLLLLAVTLIPTGFLGWALYVEYQIGNEGVTVEARVTRQREHYDSRHSNHQYEVNYEFSPPDSGETYTAFWLHRLLMVTVPRAAYYQARETHRIAIEYVPSQPELNRPPNCGATTEILVFFFLSVSLNLLVMTGVVAAAVFRGLSRRAVRPRDQFAYG